MEININELLKKPNPSGYDVGRVLLLNLANDYKNSQKTDFKPLITQKELDDLMNRLSAFDDRQDFYYHAMVFESLYKARRYVESSFHIFDNYMYRLYSMTGEMARMAELSNLIEPASLSEDALNVLGGFKTIENTYNSEKERDSIIYWYSKRIIPSMCDMLAFHEVLAIAIDIVQIEELHSLDFDENYFASAFSDLDRNVENIKSHIKTEDFEFKCGMLDKMFPKIDIELAVPAKRDVSELRKKLRNDYTDTTDLTIFITDISKKTRINYEKYFR